MASDGTPPTLNAHTWIRRETSNKDGHEGSARKKNASPPTCLPACVPAVHGADKRMDTLLLYLTTHPTIYVSIRKSTHPPTPHHAVTHTLLAQSALKETLPSITLRYLVERVAFNLLLPPSLPPLCQPPLFPPLSRCEVKKTACRSKAGSLLSMGKPERAKKRCAHTLPLRSVTDWWQRKGRGRRGGRGRGGSKERERVTGKRAIGQGRGD